MKDCVTVNDYAPVHQVTGSKICDIMTNNMCNGSDGDLCTKTISNELLTFIN